jgi:hypothetical protein
MKRDTSSVVNSANNDAASDERSSRSTTWPAPSVGRPCRQSLVTTGAWTWFFIVVEVSRVSWYGIFSILEAPQNRAQPAAE